MCLSKVFQRKIMVVRDINVTVSHSFGRGVGPRGGYTVLCRRANATPVNPCCLKVMWHNLFSTKYCFVGRFPFNIVSSSLARFIFQLWSHHPFARHIWENRDLAHFGWFRTLHMSGNPRTFENRCPKIQDGCQGDILDFVFRTTMQERIDSLIWIFLWVEVR
jgi:hypothetical protein